MPRPDSVRDHRGERPGDVRIAATGADAAVHCRHGPDPRGRPRLMPDLLVLIATILAFAALAALLRGVERL